MVCECVDGICYKPTLYPYKKLMIDYLRISDIVAILTHSNGENPMRSNVYYNLHKKLFSVRESGRVVDHSHNVMLQDARFNVGLAGQRKVRLEKKKNVHATVSGIRESVWPTMEELQSARRATYNPYKNNTFVDSETGEPVLKCSRAFLRKPFIPSHPPIIFYWS